MRAVVMAEPGSDLQVRELEIPEPAEGEVRVRVHAASVNGFDVMVAKGGVIGMMEHRFPVVIGKDFAGTVDAVGAGVTGFAPGDRVFGVVTKPYVGDGSFGEYVTVPAAVGLAPLPDAIDFTEGAALGLAGTTALMAVEAAALQGGQTVLVVGATGGVGNQAVQLAAQAGAHVIATAHGDEERAHVAALGAAEVLDYKQDLAGQVRAAYPQGVDVVIHMAGDPAAVLPLVRDGGRFVSALIMDPRQLTSETVTVLPIFATPTREMLDQLAANQAEGRTRVNVQRVYGLDDAARALHDFGQGKLGKLVITTR